MPGCKTWQVTFSKLASAMRGLWLLCCTGTSSNVLIAPVRKPLPCVGRYLCQARYQRSADELLRPQLWCGRWHQGKGDGAVAGRPFTRHSSDSCGLHLKHGSTLAVLWDINTMRDREHAQLAI